MAALSQRVAHDPLLSHNFVISLVDSSSVLARRRPSVAAPAILDVAVGGFSECTGLEMTMKPEDYKEGGSNGAVLKFPSRVTWTNITLKKGVGSYAASCGTGTTASSQGHGKRRDGVIVLLDAAHVPQHVWYFRRGLPVKYSGAALNATQSSRGDRVASRSRTKASTRCRVGALAARRRRRRRRRRRSPRRAACDAIAEIQDARWRRRTRERNAVIDGESLLHAARRRPHRRARCCDAIDDAHARRAQPRAATRKIAGAGCAAWSATRRTDHDPAAARRCSIVEWQHRLKLDETSTVQYNPTEFSLDKGAQIAEIADPGLDSPLLQFVRGQDEKLTVDLFFDTTEHGTGAGATSVTTQTDPIYALVKIEPKRHAPPILTFIWNDAVSRQLDRGRARPGAAGDGRADDQQRRERRRVGARSRASARRDQPSRPRSAAVGAALGSQRRNGFRCVVESIRQKFTLF